MWHRGVPCHVYTLSTGVIPMDDQKLCCVFNLGNIRALKITGDPELTSDSLKLFTKLTNLHKLQFNGFLYNSLYDISLSYYSSLTNLKILELYGCKFQDLPVQIPSHWHWDGFERLPQLRKLTIGHFYEITNHFIKYLPRLTQLKKLSLLHCYNLEDRDMKFLEKMTSLQHFKLGGASLVTIKGAAYLTNLKELCTLTLFGCSFTKEELLKEIRLPKITLLSSFRNRVP